MSKVLQIRGVPDDVHEALTRQADHEGTSLNRYLLSELKHLARRGENAAILRRAAHRTGRRLDPEQVVRAVRDERERHS